MNTRARALRFRTLCTDAIDANLNGFFGERNMMLSCRWFATVDDTDSVQPLKQTHGFSLWSSAYRWGPRRRRCCNRLPAAPSRAPLVRCRWWLQPLSLTREASFQSMKCLPAVRCSGLSAFYATMRTNKSNNNQRTNMLKSKINTRLPPLRYVENDIGRPRARAHKSSTRCAAAHPPVWSLQLFLHRS